jgi:GT2 family glycosyltransferase
MVQLEPTDTAPAVTIIVLNYNGAKFIRPCLDALAKQDLPNDRYAVWVIDNASRDESLEILDREYSWVTVIRNGRNDGFAGGNNVGLRQVTTPLVALLNNDARPEPDWIRRLIAPFAEPDVERLGAVSGKIVFVPRFVEFDLTTPAFHPGSMDGRELGVRIYRIEVDGVDVTEHVLWENAAYGPEGSGRERFRWTRAGGPLLIPSALDGHQPTDDIRIRLELAAEADKPVTLAWADGAATLAAGPARSEVEFTVPADVPTWDVLNNAGSKVFADGYGADRAYQEVDRGQYDTPDEVFAFCGGSVCLRTDALRQAGFFDDDFFLYYEDTDLSWRLRSAGWSIRYEPAAVARHIHSATSGEWSPLFMFHVDRNRLLMLTKNATRDLAVREVLRYPLTTASLAAREVARSRHTRRRPPARPTLLRLRVIASYLRLLPRMLARRRGLTRTATIGRRQLQDRWLVRR